METEIVYSSFPDLGSPPQESNSKTFGTRREVKHSACRTKIHTGYMDYFARAVVPYPIIQPSPTEGPTVVVGGKGRNNGRADAEGTQAEDKKVMRCELSSIQGDGTFGCGKRRYVN